jgi:hypothetical protein
MRWSSTRSRTRSSPAGNAFTPGRGVNRAHVEAGRAFAASRAREVMIDYTTAVQFHLRPGSRLTLHFLRPAPGKPWLIDFAARPLAASFRVVGVVATPGQFQPQGGGYFSGPGVYLTPAFVNGHRHDLASGDVSVVRLRPGRTAAFTAAVARLEPGGQQPDMGGLTAQDAQVQYGFHLQATALWLLAGMLAVLEVLVLAQLLLQRLTADNASWPLRWALGMTRGQLIGCGVLQAGFTGACAGLAAVITAAGLSWLTPVGTAAAAELRPGVALDVPVVIGGAVLLDAGQHHRRPGPGQRRRDRPGRGHHAGRACPGRRVRASWLRGGLGFPVQAARSGQRRAVSRLRHRPPRPGRDAHRGRAAPHPRAAGRAPLHHRDPVPARNRHSPRHAGAAAPAR